MTDAEVLEQVVAHAISHPLWVELTAFNSLLDKTANDSTGDGSVDERMWERAKNVRDVIKRFRMEVAAWEACVGEPE